MKPLKSPTTFLACNKNMGKTWEEYGKYKKNGLQEIPETRSTNVKATPRFELGVKDLQCPEARYLHIKVWLYKTAKRLGGGICSNFGYVYANTAVTKTQQNRDGNMGSDRAPILKNRGFYFYAFK